MMQELFASLKVELTDDPQQAAAMLARFAGAWADLLDKLGEYEVEASLTLNEARAKRPPRKPRLVPVNPEAA